ncbi:GNAT family N-acetyltransferase [Chelatococcus sp. SYSU_G07232]|uniref:GNAT family N-acetyltransferase n=1 Tax=Chelatococcus albus TaxID=3047466 RepID=A0ABT7AH41_9HYPH|nr:GNAT family N-acetyltransferase [Chelatococcus sp. SYSU_G07232]MDJ1158697.1 GNAT family N-acetyltransferase [Chelatococcus sp. SYSU_G07232]
MSELVISIRRARPADAAGLAAVHDAAWREAYRGIIPGIALERMIAKRGPAWWQAAVRRGRPVSVLDLGERIGGYTSFGPSRTLALPQQGEIDELYLDPVVQGLGFGTRLFAAARRELAGRGLKGLVVWALADNTRACRFYERLGGELRATAETRFGGVTLQKVAYVFR